MNTNWNQIDTNLMDPEYFAGMAVHETFDVLRREDPVHWTPSDTKHPFWSITRHRDMDNVMQAPDLFSSRGGTAIPAGGVEATPEERAIRGFDGDIVTMDPPVHPRFRQPFNKHFSVPSAARMQADIDRIVDALLDEIVPRGECDVVEDLAAQLPLRLFFPMMGIPESDWSELRKLTMGAQLADDSEFQLAGDAGKTVLQTQTSLFNYFSDLVAARRMHPQDDFTSFVAAMTVDGSLMDDRVAARTAMGVLVGGLETTRNALAVGLLAFMKYPDQAELLRNDPSLGKGATEEVLRWVTPSRNRLRIANQDVELHGKQIRAGDWIVLWTFACNRDESVYPDPHRFDITRPFEEQHLSFGNGPHVCLGRHVARLEIRTLITKFVSRITDAQPADQELAWIASQGATGLKRLNIHFTPAGSN